MKAFKQFVLKCSVALISVAFLALVGQYLVVNYAIQNPLFTWPLFIGFLTVTIVLVIAFIFIPAYQKFKSVYKELIDSEESALRMTAELNKLYNELGNSYQDLEAVQLVQDEPVTLLKMDIAGNIQFSSDKFHQIMSLESQMFSKNVFEWLKEEKLNDELVDNLRHILSGGKSWSGELNVTNEDGDLIWLDILLQPVVLGNANETRVLMIGADITEAKEAKQRSREINREKIEKRVKEQQYRSVLILEGQEEERKRIAQEIHDGIGQMLTALKLNLEGITPSSSVHMKKRIKDTKDLMKSVIKEVRRVSFNLTPSSLVDFGLAPAMKKISQEVSTLSSTNVVFENRTGFINRLEKNVETNLYRIVQEAVNNGIKYAKADKIVISFDHNFSHLTVVIQDDGQGFELEKLQTNGHFGASGHGIFNMKERAAFSNGVLNVETEVGVGTKIIVVLPLN